MVNSYQRSQCDVRTRLEVALSTPPPLPLQAIVCKQVFAVGFLKENDHYCQNQTIRPANDVRCRTTTPLPLAYELNKPTGSQNRKSKQKETQMRSETRPAEGERDSAGKLASEISRKSPSNSSTVCSYHVWPACPCF